MSWMWRLHHPCHGPELPRRDGHRPREPRVHLRDRLLESVPVLREHLRHAQHPRPRPGDRLRCVGRQSGSHGLGDHGRWRRVVDRWEPSHPCLAAQREPEDPAVQQPDLWADQRPVLADIGAGKEDEDVSNGFDRLPVQSGQPRARCRGDVRGADDRHGSQTHGRSAGGNRSTSRHVVCRDLSELQRLQRQGVHRAHEPRNPRRQPCLSGTRQAHRFRPRRRVRNSHW